MQQIRLGHINFINCLPLTFGLSHGGFSEGLDVHAGIPAYLNNLVVTGALDASPVSSIIYGRHFDKLLILPDLSISSNGALQSILLVSKFPIQQLSEAKIALTAKSATSHCLLKIIMQHAYQAAPEYCISSRVIDEGALNNVDAMLFIGDDALYAYHNRVDHYYYYDLGAEWKKLTGLSMVWAVWVVNREFASVNSALVQKMYEQITGGFAYGLTHLEAAVERALDYLPFTTSQICHYLRLLNYDFNFEHQEALMLYYRLAQEMELLSAVPNLEFVEVARGQFNKNC
jgi:chorismate dehydratase